ncbi:Mitochondrial carnitine/acylcarnitine carrier protein [Sarcoptes scabiei]|uniref:Mitochondrial carnitine/acylcarnitine carrier protein n=1 Tax=Sarcoptes scabiei TaxID=52283 RepID=A0A834VEC5_SARSC|nr:Mitochondrial carnitine/acylcarnitine carrier protein [Sarcoptes scabiei]
MAVDSLDNLITSFKQFFSGGIGGICLILAGHPMDTIKVRLQTMPTPKAGERPQYSGMIDCMTKTIHHEGFQGFYRGMVAPLIAATPINAVCFFGFGLGVSLFNGSPDAVDTLSSFQLFQAGMLSGAFTATINTPTERIKCGIRSVYKGLIPTFSRDIPGSGAYFLSYEYLKQNGSNIFHLKNENARTLLAGGLAGICYWLVAIPADVIKSRIQTAPDGKYNRLLDAIRYMYNRNGLTSFYKGTAPVLVRAFPANAACFFGYEYSMKLLSLIL